MISGPGKRLFCWEGPGETCIPLYTRKHFARMSASGMDTPKNEGAPLPHYRLQTGGRTNNGAGPLSNRERGDRIEPNSFFLLHYSFLLQ